MQPRLNLVQTKKKASCIVFLVEVIINYDDNDKDEGARIQHQVSTTTIVNEIATSDEQHFNQSQETKQNIESITITTTSTITGNNEAIESEMNDAATTNGDDMMLPKQQQ